MKVQEKKISDEARQKEEEKMRKVEEEFIEREEEEDEEDEESEHDQDEDEDEQEEEREEEYIKENLDGGEGGEKKEEEEVKEREERKEREEAGKTKDKDEREGREEEGKDQEKNENEQQKVQEKEREEMDQEDEKDEEEEEKEDKDPDDDFSNIYFLNGVIEQGLPQPYSFQSSKEVTRTGGNGTAFMHLSHLMTLEADYFIEFEVTDMRPPFGVGFIYKERVLDLKEGDEFDFHKCPKDILSGDGDGQEEEDEETILESGETVSDAGCDMYSGALFHYWATDIDEKGDGSELPIYVSDVECFETDLEYSLEGINSLLGSTPWQGTYSDKKGGKELPHNQKRYLGVYICPKEDQIRFFSNGFLAYVAEYGVSDEVLL